VYIDGAHPTFNFILSLALSVGLSKPDIEH
jgi:hypothetical protein